MLGFCMPASATAGFDPFAAAGIEQRTGARIPLETGFTDQDGRVVRLGELLQGRPVLLAPVYFTCPNVCGAQLATLFQVLASVGYRVGKDYDVIAYSFNPDETPANARVERDKLGKQWPQLIDAPGVHFLVGDEAAAKALSNAIGFRYRYDPAIRQYAHVSAVGVLTSQGQLSRWLYGLGYQATDLRLAITEAGRGQVGSLGDRLLLLCYHYDPKTGGYDSLVMGALRVGGLATVFALAGFIGLALHRERCRQRSGE
ncbi:SCO family protein [Pseudomonas corrugata]|nr:SCO family protein [Pseudomonas corrugata]